MVKPLFVYSKTNISSLLGSILLSFLFFSQHFLEISQNLFSSTIPFKILLGLGAVFSLLFFKKNNIFNHSIFFIIILLYFLLSFLINNTYTTKSVFESFIIYGFCAFAYSFCTFKESTFFRISLIVGITWLITFLITNKFYIDNSFSFGYLILPILISSFFLLFEKQKIVFLIIKILIFSFLLFLLVAKGSRGPVFCFVIFLFLFFGRYLKNKVFRIIFIILIISFLLFVLNFESIVIWIHNSFPGRISFIEKTYSLIKSSVGISNGRSNIFFSVLYEYSPFDFIFGIGIGTYSSTHALEGYTHNIFLSVVLDFGLLGLCFLIASIYVCLSSIYKQRNNYYLYLLATSIIVLLFSGDYWVYFTFWLFAFISLKEMSKVGIFNSRINNEKKCEYVYIRI